VNWLGPEGYADFKNPVDDPPLCNLCSFPLKLSNDSAVDSSCDTFKACMDICAYWKHVLTLVDTFGEKMYEHLTFVAKAALTLSYGMAAPERGFLVNNAFVTKDRRALSERSFVALRVVEEVSRFFGSCTNVPVTMDNGLLVRWSNCVILSTA